MNSSHPEEIPFGAMLSISSRASFIFLNDHLRPLGLSAGQFPVLMLLAKEQNITQETLVRHYHLDKGTIARAVRKLEDAGYIRRIIDPSNRRAVRLFLTKNGENVLPRLQAIGHDWEAQVCSGLSAKQRGDLHSLMQVVARNSCRYMQESGGACDAVR